MPYIYSNRGLSVRWEDETYVLKNEETALDIFVAPPALPAPPPSLPLETRLAQVEARLEQFLKIATGITGGIAGAPPPRP